MNLWRFGLIILITLVAMGCAHKKPPEPAPVTPVAPPEEVKLYEVTVRQVVMDDIGRRISAPLIILANKGDANQILPIRVGMSEGLSINMALEKRVPERPGTHDLFASVLGQFDMKLVKVVITDLREDTYIATMRMESHGETNEIDARPSDAIAIALRSVAPIFVSEEVIRKGGWMKAPQQEEKPEKAEKKEDML